MSNTLLEPQPGQGADFVIKRAEQLQTENASRGFVTELWESIKYSGAQSPALGLAQVVDRTCGTKWMPSVTFMDAPKPAASASDFHAQQIGGALGIAGDFFVVSRLKKLTQRLWTGSAPAENAALTFRQALWQTARTGAIYEGLCIPSDNNESLILGRSRNALHGALTFGSMTASARGIQELGIVRNRIGVGVISGIPAGVVSAQSESLLNGHGLASVQESTKSAYIFALTGGLLTAVHEIPLSNRVKQVGTKSADLSIDKQLVSPKSSVREPNLWQLPVLELGSAEPVTLGKKASTSASTTLSISDLPSVVSAPKRSQLLSAAETSLPPNHPETKRLFEARQKAEAIDSDKMIWTPTESSMETRRWLQDTAGDLAKGDYGNAYHKASSLVDPFSSVTNVKVDRRIKPGNIKTSEELSNHLVQLQMQGKASKKVKTELGGVPETEYVIKQPRTVLELESGTHVDIMHPTQDIQGKSLTSADAAQVQAFRQTEFGKRIMAEHAMIAIEEHFHLQQFLNGMKVISPTYAQFLNENARRDRNCDLLAAANDIPNRGSGPNVETRSERTVEQEVVAALYDAGVPTDLIKLHYEGNYAELRKPVMDFIRAREGDAPTKVLQEPSAYNPSPLPRTGQ